MAYLLVLMTTIATTLGIALVISTAERRVDSSLVPGILIGGLALVIAELIIGFGSGIIGVWVK